MSELVLGNAAKLEYLCYTPSMKLSQYAKQQGMSYRTALRWWKAGLVKGYQSPTGTIIVREEPPKEVLAVQRVAIYARVSSHEHRENLERQAERMISYGAAKGYSGASGGSLLTTQMIWKIYRGSLTN